MAVNTVEYKVLPWQAYDTDGLESELRSLGAEGWLLVSVTPIIANANTMQLIHHLMRSAEPVHRAGFPIGQS